MHDRVCNIQFIVYTKLTSHHVLHKCIHFASCRAIAAVYFTASSLTQASSIAPDISKAKVSTTRILTLLHRRPQIKVAASDNRMELVCPV